MSATTDSIGATTDVRAADRSVVRSVAMDSQSEVALGRLAPQKTQNDAVEAFAQRTIADHTTAMTQAINLARSQDAAIQRFDNAQLAVIECARRRALLLALMDRGPGLTRSASAAPHVAVAGSTECAEFAHLRAQRSVLCELIRANGGCVFC